MLSPRLILDRSRQVSPVLWWSGGLALVASFAFLLLMVFDARLINGVSVWTKPWKFYVSIAIHLWTLAFALALLSDESLRPHATNRLAWVAAICTLIELTYITWRAARGEASHFISARHGLR